MYCSSSVSFDLPRVSGPADSFSDGPGYSDSAGSNEVSVPRDAVH